MKRPFNYFSKNIYTYFAITITMLGVLFPALVTKAAVMQSATYQIQSDSVNAGGAPSTSTSYGLNDTAGELATGDSNSASYYMHAGYWQMQQSSISITSPSDLALASIGGVAGGGSEGTTSWTVTTDNIAGYTMTVQASTSPALKSLLDSFADYTPSGADPDYTFTNASANSSFGFSPEGADTTARFKDNGSICNTGSGETSAKCWDGLSTTPATIAGSTSGNSPSGTAVTVRFRAETGTGHIQTAGSYSATITVTATTL
jgi:hypothetical protein